MKLQIRIFAGLAELLGSSRIEIDIDDSEKVTADRLKRHLAGLFPEAAEHLTAAFVAKNQAYAGAEEPLAVGDEIALIPPVSGGQTAESDHSPLLSDEAEAAALYVITRSRISIEQVTRKVILPDHGAVLTFTGTTREHTKGERTVLLEYTAYEPMALATMRQIGREIAERWPGTLLAITHRIGRVEIAETSVVIAVSAPHRAEVYEASRYAIERLKQIVPIWKKEIWENGFEWKGHQKGPWNPTAPLFSDAAGGENA